MWVTAEAEARAPHEAGRPGIRVRWTGSRDLFPHLPCFNKNTLVGIPVQTKGRTLLSKAGLAAGHGRPAMADLASISSIC